MTRRAAPKSDSLAENPPPRAIALARRLGINPSMSPDQVLRRAQRILSSDPGLMRSFLADMGFKDYGFTVVRPQDEWRDESTSSFLYATDDPSEYDKAIREYEEEWEDEPWIVHDWSRAVFGRPDLVQYNPPPGVFAPGTVVRKKGERRNYVVWKVWVGARGYRRFYELLPMNAALGRDAPFANDFELERSTALFEFTGKGAKRRRELFWRERSVKPIDEHPLAPKQKTNPGHRHPRLKRPVPRAAVEGELLELYRQSGLPGQPTIAWPNELTRLHERDPRRYAQVFTPSGPPGFAGAGVPHFEFAEQTRWLPRPHRLGLAAHEIGHCLRPGTEADADRAARDNLGVRITYDPRWPGRGLQRGHRLNPPVRAYLGADKVPVIAVGKAYPDSAIYWVVRFVDGSEGVALAYDLYGLDGRRWATPPTGRSQAWL